MSNDVVAKEADQDKLYGWISLQMIEHHERRAAWGAEGSKHAALIYSGIDGSDAVVSMVSRSMKSGAFFEDMVFVGELSHYRRPATAQEVQKAKESLAGKALEAGHGLAEKLAQKRSEPQASAEQQSAPGSPGSKL